VTLWWRGGSRGRERRRRMVWQRRSSRRSVRAHMTAAAAAAADEMGRGAFWHAHTVSYSVPRVGPLVLRRPSLRRLAAMLRPMLVPRVCQSPACARTPVARQVPVRCPRRDPRTGSAAGERPRSAAAHRPPRPGARRSWSAPSRACVLTVIEPYSLLWSYELQVPVLRPVLAAALARGCCGVLGERLPESRSRL